MAVKRFNGIVEKIGSVGVAEIWKWLQAIPFEDWPQQDPIGGKLRPAMVNDRSWNNFGAVTDPLVQSIISHVGGRELSRLLSVVMPGHNIPPHVDKVSSDWRGRIHIPLQTDPKSTFTVGDLVHQLEVGSAYLVNITALHSVENCGEVPRIHLMFDIGE